MIMKLLWWTLMTTRNFMFITIPCKYIQCPKGNRLLYSSFKRHISHKQNINRRCWITTKKKHHNNNNMVTFGNPCILFENNRSLTTTFIYTSFYFNWAHHLQFNFLKAYSCSTMFVIQVHICIRSRRNALIVCIHAISFILDFMNVEYTWRHIDDYLPLIADTLVSSHF